METAYFSKKVVRSVSTGEKGDRLVALKQEVDQLFTSALKIR